MTRPRSILHRTPRARPHFYFTHTRALQNNTNETTLRIIYNSTTNNRKLTKRYNVETRIVTRVRLLHLLDGCGIHNGYKVLVNTSKSLFLTSCSKSHFWPSHTYMRS